MISQLISFLGRPARSGIHYISAIEGENALMLLHIGCEDLGQPCISSMQWDMLMKIYAPYQLNSCSPFS